MVIAVCDAVQCKLDSIEEGNVSLYTLEIILCGFQSICCVLVFILASWNALTVTIYRCLAMMSFLIFLSELGHKILSSLPSSEIIHATQSSWCQRGGKKIAFKKLFDNKFYIV